MANGLSNNPTGNTPTPENGADPKSFGIIPAIIGVVGALGAAFASNRGNKKEAEKQKAFQEDMWHQQNAYNSPEQQMARLKEAGLNPNLIYGSGVSGATGLADKVGSYDRAEITYDNPIAAGMSTATDVGRISNMEAQNAVMHADVPLKNAQALSTIANSKKINVDRKLVEQTMDGQIDAIRLNNRLRKENIVGTQIDNYVKDKTKSARIKQESQRLILAGENIKNLKSKTKGQDLENIIKAYDARLQKVYGIPASNTGLIINLIRSVLGVGTRAYDFGKEHNVSPSLIR